MTLPVALSSEVEMCHLTLKDRRGMLKKQRGRSKSECEGTSG